jgi:hypothetical protein
MAWPSLAVCGAAFSVAPFFLGKKKTRPKRGEPFQQVPFPQENQNGDRQNRRDTGGASAEQSAAACTYCERLTLTAR